MRDLKPDDIKAGDIFYERVSGHTIQFVALDEPRRTDVVIRKGEEPRPQWNWTAQNNKTKEITEFTITSGFEHYGPKIYSEPAYWHP